MRGVIWLPLALWVLGAACAQQPPVPLVMRDAPARGQEPAQEQERDRMIALASVAGAPAAPTVISAIVAPIVTEPLPPPSSTAQPASTAAPAAQRVTAVAPPGPAPTPVPPMSAILPNAAPGQIVITGATVRKGTSGGSQATIMVTNVSSVPIDYFLLQICKNGTITTGCGRSGRLDPGDLIAPGATLPWTITYADQTITQVVVTPVRARVANAGGEWLAPAGMAAVTSR